MSAPQTYGASLYDLAKDEGMSREILVDLEGIVSLFNEHTAYVKILDAPQIERERRINQKEENLDNMSVTNGLDAIKNPSV